MYYKINNLHKYLNGRVELFIIMAVEG